MAKRKSPLQRPAKAASKKLASAAGPKGTKPKSNKPRQAYYVLSTHWDREWYQPFQWFRQQLVEAFDHILDGQPSKVGGRRKKRLKGPFYTDGQAIVLEDYLEIRPHRRAEVEEALRAGRWKSGPWYVMPDEFLVSGESMVRNIRMGRDVVREMGGEPSNAGYICDLFGHISQLPQIFAGFGIESAFLWRGINHQEPTHFLWVGADGTECAVYKFTKHGYCELAFRAREAHLPNAKFNAKRQQKQLIQFIKEEAKRTKIAPILLFDGADHQAWDERFYTEVLLPVIENPPAGFEIKHVDLDVYAKAMMAEKHEIEHVAEGELRETLKEVIPTAQQIPGVLSSRVPLKQRNARCEALLCQVAEPLAAIEAGSLGRGGQEDFLRIAWRWLLKNHPHDSIGGCSIDQVHRDMEFRFSQCEQISERLRDEALQRIGATIEGEIGKDELRVIAWNLLPKPFSGVTQIELETPKSWPSFGEFFHFEDKPSFRIFDPEGNEVPYQRISQEINKYKPSYWRTKFPDIEKVTLVTVAVDIEVPAMGWTCFSVRPGEAKKPLRYDVEFPKPLSKNLSHVDKNSVFFPQGSDEETGGVKNEIWFTNDGGEISLNSQNLNIKLNEFIDTADIGDGWFHGEPVNQSSISSEHALATLSWEKKGDLFSEAKSRIELRLPREFDFRTMKRSDDYETLVIETTYSISASSPTVACETVVQNNIKDHRLKLKLGRLDLFEVIEYLTDQAFDVVSRSSEPPEDQHLYYELPIPEKPQQSWAAVWGETDMNSGTQAGVALVAPGLLESALQPEGDSLELTLLRATRRTVLQAAAPGEGEPDGQLQGELRFRYDVVPLSGAPDRRRLFEHGQQMAAGGLQVAQLRPQHQRIYDEPGAERLPATAAGLVLGGKAVLTSCRRMTDGDGATALEVRIFNPEETAIEATLKPGLALLGNRGKGSPVKDIELRNFDSEPVEPREDQLTWSKGIASILLAPKEIATIAFLLH